jgi:SnoaL-like domain
MISEPPSIVLHKGNGLFRPSDNTIRQDCFFYYEPLCTTPQGAKTIIHKENQGMPNHTPGAAFDAQTMADQLAIQEIVALHSRGLDRLDLECLQACYWPDAEVDYGAFKGPAATFAELVMGALGGQYELTRHCLSNQLISIAGDKARSETNVTAAHLFIGAEKEMLFYGRYLDQLEKRGGNWKIIHRQVVMDWSKEHDVVDERNGEAFGALSKGAHTETDPLYPFQQSLSA